MTLHRTAPARDKIVADIHHLLTSRNDEVPPDGYDRVDYRLSIVLGAAYDDDDPDDRSQPIRDLLTDVLHVCAEKDLDVYKLLERARWMYDEEVQEWGPR